MTARRPVPQAQQSVSRAAITVVAEAHRVGHPVSIHCARADRPSFPAVTYIRTSGIQMASVRARHRVRQPLQPGRRLVCCRRFLSCTDVVAVEDEHTDGGTWRGASHPPRTAPPRHVSLYRDRASRADTAEPPVTTTQCQRPRRCSGVITGCLPLRGRLPRLHASGSLSLVAAGLSRG